MEHQQSDAVATLTARVKELRRARGWTGAELGERLTEAGVKWDRSIVANVENGRRKAFTVDELLALALVFDVAPLHLLVAPDAERFQVAPNREYEASRVRAWLRGSHPLPGIHARTFRSEVPLEELEAQRQGFERMAGWDAMDLDTVKRTRPELWEGDSGEHR